MRLILMGFIAFTGDKLGFYDRISGCEVVSIHKPQDATVVRSFLYAALSSSFFGFCNFLGFMAYTHFMEAAL